jgi:hypothetical protein
MKGCNDRAATPLSAPARWPTQRASLPTRPVGKLDLAKQLLYLEHLVTRKIDFATIARVSALSLLGSVCRPLEAAPHRPQMKVP